MLLCFLMISSYNVYNYYNPSRNNLALCKRNVHFLTRILQERGHFSAIEQGRTFLVVYISPEAFLMATVFVEFPRRFG